MSNNYEHSALRKKIHEVIFGANTLGGVLFDIALLIVIILSIIVISLETVQGIGWQLDDEGGHDPGPYGNLFTTLKWVFTGIFTVEYLLRIYCVNRPTKYIFSFWGIVDLLAFLPDYILLLVSFSPGAEYDPHGFAVIRSLRLIRAFRIFNLGWFQLEADDLGNAIWRARAKIIVFLAVVLILVTVTGTIMYEIENELAGDKSQFKSIPDGIYWAIVTMTTVGFGDIVPTTVPGKFLSAFLILVGYSLIIVPTGFVTAEVIESRRRKITVISCPSCVTEGHDADAKFCKYCGETM